MRVVLIVYGGLLRWGVRDAPTVPAVKLGGLSAIGLPGFRDACQYININFNVSRHSQSLPFFISKVLR
jgi:hypothetical protein